MAEEVLPAGHVYPIPEELELRDTIDFAYDKGLTIDAKADAEVGRGDTEIIVERTRTDGRTANDRRAQVVIIPD